MNTTGETGLSKQETYTDEQFYKDFPEKLIKCGWCQKKFSTQFGAKFCSDKCYKKRVSYNHKYWKKNYTKSGRNSVGKDARRLKGTGRRKSW